MRDGRLEADDAVVVVVRELSKGKGRLVLLAPKKDAIVRLKAWGAIDRLMSTPAEVNAALKVVEVGDTSWMLDVGMFRCD